MADRPENEHDKTPEVVVDEGVVEKLVLLLVNVRSRRDVTRAAMQAYGLMEVQAIAATTETQRRISSASAVSFRCRVRPTKRGS